MAGLNERRRELAVLRAVGASPLDVLILLTIEGALVTVGGVVLGIAAPGGSRRWRSGPGCNRSSA